MPRRILLLLFLYAISLGVMLMSALSAGAATYAGIVVDAKSGKVLYAHRADARAYPASLTKMMTLYLLFEAMEAGKVSKSTKIAMSAYAASKPPTKLGVKPGGTFTVEQAILALVTKSANDVAAAVAEKLGGSEAEFARMMTRKARQLGMKDTTFRNASGLPDGAQVSTARDMATLGIALREHFPQYYDYFAARSFSYGGNRLANHNRLLGRVNGVDGIKTGYTRASGFNLVSSVKANGRSIVAVVLGGKSGASRNAQMEKLIATYLPKATQGPDRALVARSGATPFTVAAAPELPSRGPTPSYREPALDPSTRRIVAAHNVPQAVPSPRAADAGAFDVAAVQRKLLQTSGRRLPLPEPSPAATDGVRTGAVPHVDTMAFAIEEGDRSPAAEAVDIQAPVRDGWQIQIGATPSRDSALRLLREARAKAPDLLAAVADHTETVAKGSETLYRARFAGFSSKSEAWGACGVLKKKKFACLALAN
ncbi:MAG: D-alanyl-D-alanine carboxypeptidase [Alphaproteobacteria bacterium]|nr:MAG: D-alanyl-D-alanine carboxypeptidase [Alphaproteobacteria bacterium]